MEGKRNSRRRRVRREHEANRMEEQLWAMAYEEVWPLLRRALSDRVPTPSIVSDEAVEVAIPRRA